MIHIILPVHNESKTIDKTIMRVCYWSKKYLPESEIVFVNDHSKDNTNHSDKYVGFENLRLINNMSCPGKGSALKYAFLKIIDEIKEDDFVVFLDGDGQIDISEINTILKMMNIYNADVCIGSKRHPYSVTEYNLLRSIVSKTYNFIIRHLFNLPYHDTQCGIKMFKAHALVETIGRVHTKRFAFDLELLVALRAKKFRIVEAPVTISKQLNSGSVNLKNIFQTFSDTVKIFIKLKNNYYKS